MNKIFLILVFFSPLITTAQDGGSSAPSFIAMPYEASEKVSYKEAIKVCETSTLYGHDNWRLPTIDELQEAFLDEESTRLGQDWYWSIDEQDKVSAWSLKKNGVAYSKKKSELMYPRCVRDYKEIKVQTSEKKVGQEFKWDEAKEYCKNLTDLGHNDWRLPEISELLHIYKKGEVVNFDEKFSRAWSTWFWSNSENYDGKVWTLLLFKSAEIEHKFSRERKNTKFETVCIRDLE